MANTTRHVHVQEDERFSVEVKRFGGEGNRAFTSIVVTVGSDTTAYFVSGHDGHRLFDVGETFKRLGELVHEQAEHLIMTATYGDPNDAEAVVPTDRVQCKNTWSTEADEHVRLQLSGEFQALHQDDGDDKSPEWTEGFDEGVYFERAAAEGVILPMPEGPDPEWMQGFEAGRNAYQKQH